MSPVDFTTTEKVEMTRTFVPKAGARVKPGTAQNIGALVDEITQVHGNGIDPDDLHDTIVERSRPEHSPTHDDFIWDDAAAAKVQRRDQARYYVRSIEVQPSEEVYADRPYRQVVVLPKEDGSSVYMKTEKVLADKGWREIYLDKAQRDIIGMQRRYEQLTELCAVLDQTRLAIEGLRNRTPKGATDSGAPAGA